MSWQAADEDAALKIMTDAELREYVRGAPRLTVAEATARNRRPEPYWTGDEDSGVNSWRFPRGMRDADIRAEVTRQGWDPEGYPCRCSEGDCCGATFARALLIEQGRHGKRAEQFVGRCI